ncbi:MAG: glycosyltransferase family 2 protein [Nitrososphaeraceae archaeon]
MQETVLAGLLTFLWLINIPIAVLAVLRFITNNRVFITSDLRRIRNDPEIIFQITTRSATRTPVVKRGIQSILESCRKVEYNRFKISVITDDPTDNSELDGYGCEVVLVPKSFKTSAIKKGRALQYALLHRRSQDENKKQIWIYHMDDESFVTTQTILSLLKFIRDGKGVASEGPIFYPLKFESANVLTALAESIRPFTCYDCVSQMTNKVVIKTPPLHMHGSNLLVRSDVEDNIGWNFGPTLAEDQLFGYLVYEKYGSNSMGWHGGVLLEQPPLNIKDHFMQRRRWVLGSLQNVDKFSTIHRIKLSYKLMTYFLGFAAGVLSTIVSIYVNLPIVLSFLSFGGVGTGYGIATDTIVSSFMDNLNVAFQQFYSNSALHNWTTAGPIEFATGVLLLFSSLIWLFSYQLGLFQNLRFSQISLSKKILFHFQTLFLCPIIGLVETFPAFYSIIEYTFRNNRNEGTPIYDFYVIDK